jgi:hypothetical protein
LKNPAAVQQFENLPDDVIVPDPIAADILGISIWTLRRAGPVRPVQLSPKRRGRRLGDLRRLIRGEPAAT